MYQKFYIRQSGIVSDTLRVFASLPGGTKDEWFPVSTFVGQSSTAKIYKAYYDHDGRVMIMFGDGIEGRIPPRNCVVSTEVWFGGGSAGNRVGAGQLTRTLSTLNYLSSVTNAEAPSGGADVKTNAQLKSIGPNVVKSLWAARSLSNVEALVENYPGVREASVVDMDTNVEDSSLLPAYRWETNVYVLPEEATRPNALFLSRIRAYLADRKVVGTKLLPLSPVFYTFYLNMTVRIFENYLKNKITIHNTLTAALDSYFSNLSLGRRVNSSDIIAIGEAISGIDSLTLTNVDAVKEEGQAGSSVAVVSSSSFDFYELDPGEKASSSNGDGNYTITYQIVSVI
jgi:hypothetical protein